MTWFQRHDELKIVNDGVNESRVSFSSNIDTSRMRCRHNVVYGEATGVVVCVVLYCKEH